MPGTGGLRDVVRESVARCRYAGEARPARDAALASQLADEAFLVLALTGATLLKRLQELLDLLNAKPALPSGRPVRLEVAHIGPPANRAKGDPERIGGLRSGQTERSCSSFGSMSAFQSAFAKMPQVVQQLHNIYL